MQNVVDYLRANSPSYSADMLNSQLREAGHAPETINAAWLHVGTPMSATAVRPPVMGGGGFEFEHSLERRNPARLIAMGLVGVIAVVAVAFVAIGLAGGGIKLSVTDGRADSAREALDIAAENQDLSDEEVAAATQALGAGEIDVTLPKGWTKVDKGIWRDERTGNNVNVMTFDTPGLSLDQATPDVLAQIKAVKGVVIRKGPIAAQLDGMPAKRVYYTMDTGDVVVDGSQWFAINGDQAHVVTATLMPDGREDADEVTKVVESLRFG